VAAAPRFAQEYFVDFQVPEPHVALKTSDFDYPLEPELIAQRPAGRREASRLMRLFRGSGAVEHRRFSELPELLRPGDLLVLNDTRVVPAKLAARRRTGGRIDGLFCREIRPGRWEVLLRGAGRCRPGEPLALDADAAVTMTIDENLGAGRYVVRVTPPRPAEALLDRIGAAPLPPYIRRPADMTDEADRQRYQTVYASRPGAVAAPTAGLHFTEKLLADLARCGIQTATVTLHVGPGTFLPVKAERPRDHPMHAEWYELPPEAARDVAQARREGRRVVAVGTTSVRVLETVATGGELRGASGWTDLFIHPPASFRAVDALITNFHLPRSTVLMLVAAFCDPGGTGGVEVVLRAYAEAQRRRYRFYSYGDAMLIE
jgi:S-adenosylmethionine:tRNA ribosyltransferase-isomerase